MTVLRGDCVEVMAGMEPDSVDAIVCDPPYGLEFMGKEWDRLWDKRHKGGFRATGRVGPTYQAGAPAEAFHHAWATAALRVAKPGAYLLAFGGTRTVHRMTCALEDAGWVIRDMLVWAYAQGFPKSRASLKPAWEPIVLARKPGASRDLNIDAARIPGAMDGTWGARQASSIGYGGTEPTDYRTEKHEAGRWPSNLLLTDPIFDGGWEGVVGGGEVKATRSMRGERHGNVYNAPAGPDTMRGYADSGTYSRFFMVDGLRCPDHGESMPCGSCAPEHERCRCHCYCADQREVGDVCRPCSQVCAAKFLLIPKAPTRERVLSDGRRSPHPTQKPEALIRHLVTLVTPPGGLVLDPFLGSGTLGVVCEGLGVRWVGIEREPEYADWAEERIKDKRPEWAAA